MSAPERWLPLLRRACDAAGEAVRDMPPAERRRPVGAGAGGDTTMVVDQAETCVRGLCDLLIEAFGDGGLQPVAIDALPTRYVLPALAGERYVWVDYRDGPYAVHGVDPDGRELRLSSDRAEIGALSNVAASGQRVVWADRRSGRWRLVAGSWR